MNSLIVKVEITPGQGLLDAIRSMMDVARTLNCCVDSDFNGDYVIVSPRDTVEEAIKTYEIMKKPKKYKAKKQEPQADRGCDDKQAQEQGGDDNSRGGWYLHSTIDELVKTRDDLRAKLTAEKKHNADLLKKYQDLVAWADKQAGVPCEQIRHQHEVEELKEKISKYQDKQGHFYQKLLKAGYGCHWCNNLDQLVEVICQDSNWGERSVKKLLEENAVLLEVYKNAHALALGDDWNNGTQAKFHRDPLIKAIVIAKNVITKVEKINDSN